VITIIAISIVAGILLGYATSARTPNDGLEDLVRNVLVGITGAFVGMQVAGGVFGSAEAGISAVALTVAAIAGAMLLLFIVNRVRRA
jgi:uncharacterized membrane protein YeaQ/YmgE (transglycosylase-associated protein family)